MTGGAKSGLCGALLFCFADTALAQRYECRSQTQPGQIIEQYGVPCAPGTDVRTTPSRDAAWRREQELEQKKTDVAREIDRAFLRREVVFGMTTAQVLALWGNPTKHVTQQTDGGQPVEYWYWRCPRPGPPPTLYNVTRFRGGKLYSIERAC
jgi:hypothetical protein